MFTKINYPMTIKGFKSYTNKIFILYLFTWILERWKINIDTHAMLWKMSAVIKIH